MFTMRRIIALFSRSKRIQQRPIQSEKYETNEEEQDIKESLGIDDNFDYLEGLQQITPFGQDPKHQWLANLRNHVENNSFTSLELLRSRQQLYIKGLIQNDDPSTLLSNLFGLKIDTFAKFRKWDEVAVDCDNRLKLIKQQTEDQKIVFQILCTYNQKCISSIMNDHDRLHTLLLSKYPRVTHKKRKLDADKGKVVDESIMFYLTAVERAELIKDDSSNYDIYFETVRMQAIGLFILGEKEKAFKRLGKLLGNNYRPEMKQEIIPIIVAALSVNNKPKQLLRPQLVQKLSQIEKLSESELQQMSQKSLDAATAELIINQTALTINDKPIKQLQDSVFRHYARVLCLIAQNYYLQGKKEDSLRLLTFLKERQDVKAHIGILITFIEMGIAFDNKSFQQVTRLFDQYKDSQMNLLEEQQEQVAGDSFYDIRTINNDILRVNIYKLMCNVCKEQSLTEQAEEIKDEAEAMETTLLTYMLKQPQFSEIHLEKIEDWRFNKQVRIPYYYFDLKLDQYFTSDWDVVQEIL